MKPLTVELMWSLAPRQWLGGGQRRVLIGKQWVGVYNHLYSQSVKGET